jgi:hypothetical protein
MSVAGIASTMFGRCRVSGDAARRFSQLATAHFPIATTSHITGPCRIAATEVRS